MNTILVPLDFSAVTPRVIQTVLDLARPSKAKVLFLHVVPPPVIMTAYGISEVNFPESLGKEEERARTEMEKYSRQLKAEGIDASILSVQGVPVDAILLLAREKKSDMLVMGSHGHGAFYEFIVGSTTRGVLKQFHGPVVLVPSRQTAAERERT